MIPDVKKRAFNNIDTLYQSDTSTNKNWYDSEINIINNNSYISSDLPMKLKY